MRAKKGWEGQASPPGSGQVRIGNDEGKLTPAAKQILPSYDSNLLAHFQAEELLTLVFSSYLPEYKYTYNLDVQPNSR